MNSIECNKTIEMDSNNNEDSAIMILNKEHLHTI